MIVSLTGTLQTCALPWVVIDVQGIGYEVEMPHADWYQLPEMGSSIVLHTRFVVREDAQLLFGFMSSRTRDLFNELLRVSGVGPKLALMVLSELSVDRVIQIVMQKQVDALMSVKGVGAKVAQRLVIELQSRLKHWQVSAPSVASQYDEEALAALMALGYSQQRADKALKSLEQSGDTQTLVRLALQVI